MKVLSLVLISIVVLFVLFQSFVIMPKSKTEQQKYIVIRDYKDFEIRYYPPATIASVNSNAKSYKELSGPGFRKLAGYIFGGNEANENIAMTAPVQMDINDSISTMSFVMPAEYEIENLPKPNDPNVSIKTTAAEYVGAIKFGGYASDDDLKMYSEKLKNHLKQNGITAYGNYRFYGYNPPYQVIDRRNEIVVSVKWKK